MKLLIDHEKTIYRFFDIQRQRDGSIYLTVDREPRDPTSRLTRKPGEMQFAATAPPSTSRKLSYHTTGRVNYHGLVSAPPSFFEPLVDITQANHVLAVSIPSVALLDIHAGEVDLAVGDISVQIDHSERFAIGVTFAPLSLQEQRHHGVTYDCGEFALIVHPVTFNIEPPSPQHFVYAASPSMFPNQKVGKHEAELAYVQGNGPSEIVVHGPNERGHYTMYFAVVMRAVPSVNVVLTDPSHRFELLANDKPHKLTFRIHGKGDLIRETDLRPFIRSIELHAEL